MTRFTGFGDEPDDDPPASREVIRGELADGPSSGSTGAEDASPRYLTSEPFTPSGARGPQFSILGPPDRSQLDLKNPVLGGALGFIFGPLGLLYSNLPWAVGLGLLTVALIVNGTWVALPAVWLTCAFIGFASTLRHNAKLLLSGVSRRPGGSTQPPGSGRPPGGSTQPPGPGRSPGGNR